MAVHFFNDDVDFSISDETLLRKWINLVVTNHKKRLGKITYLFCSDEKIYQTNVRFLNHNTYTDIITFDYVENDLISGDIIISIDRVEENARVFNVSFEQELHRVIIHGLLHLLGFKDKSPEDEAMMRRKEDESLALLNTIV